MEEPATLGGVVTWQPARDVYARIEAADEAEKHGDGIERFKEALKPKRPLGGRPKARGASATLRLRPVAHEQFGYRSSSVLIAFAAASMEGVGEPGDASDST